MAARTNLFRAPLWTTQLKLTDLRMRLRCANRIPHGPESCLCQNDDNLPRWQGNEVNCGEPVRGEGYVRPQSLASLGRIKAKPLRPQALSLLIKRLNFICAVRVAGFRRIGLSEFS